MRRRLLPLGIKNRTKTELPALIALEAIGKPWFSESHHADLLAVAMVSLAISEDGSDIQATAAQLMQRLGREPIEIDVIRPAVVHLSAWLQRQPNGRIQDAIERLQKKPLPMPESDAPPSPRNT